MPSVVGFCTAKFTPVCVGLKDAVKLEAFFKDTPPGSVSASGIPDGKYEVGKTYPVDITIE
jgi:hypothetical protein